MLNLTGMNQQQPHTIALVASLPAGLSAAVHRQQVKTLRLDKVELLWKSGSRRQ